MHELYWGLSMRAGKEPGINVLNTLLGSLGNNDDDCNTNVTNFQI